MGGTVLDRLLQVIGLQQTVYQTAGKAVAAADPVQDLQVGAVLSFEEFTRFRESTSVSLHRAYTRLMSVPFKQDIGLTQEVKHELRQLENQLKSRLLDSEKKWMVQLHAGELFERCGGLSLVDKCFLPLGVLTMMRGKKVTWQMVL